MTINITGQIVVGGNLSMATAGLPVILQSNFDQTPPQELVSATSGTLNGGSTIEAAAARFGTSGLRSVSTLTDGAYFDRTGSNGLGPEFTIEFWYYPRTFPSGSNNFDTLISKTTSFGEARDIWVFIFNPGGGADSLYVWDSTGANLITPTDIAGVITTNNWHHIAIVQDATTLTVYVNGAVFATGSTATFPDTVGRNWWIGSDGGENHGADADFDDLRITNAAIYTAPFTPPAAALPLP